MTFQPKSATFLRGRPVWREHAPHPALAVWISSYWTLETDETGHVVRTIPDGCVDLTLRLHPAPGAFVAGPHARPRTWRVDERMHLVGARMLPGAAALLGIDVEALTDEWTPLAALVPSSVARALVVAARRGDEAAALVALDAFLAQRLLNREVDPRLSRALRAVFARGGRITMAELARASGAHTRTLARLFERHVGLAPKRFARVVRFQAALRALPEGKAAAGVATALGYCDQAHFIRDARELFGGTPREILRLVDRTR